MPTRRERAVNVKPSSRQIQILRAVAPLAAHHPVTASTIRVFPPPWSNAPVCIEPAAKYFALIELLHLRGPNNGQDESCLPNVKSSNALNLKRKRGQDVDVGHECGMGMESARVGGGSCKTVSRLNCSL